MSKIRYIDSHAHLSDEAYDQDYEEVITRLYENNILKVNLIGVDIPSLNVSLSMKEQHPDLFDVTVGLHPQDIAFYTAEDAQEIFNMFKDPRIVCVGEIGLDYHWHPEEKELQKEMFIKQIHLANEVKKPVMIHSRDAMQDTYEILKEHRPQYGCVMHAFSGSVEMAREFVKLGFLISLGGPVTFKNARVPKEVAMDVPLGSLLTETDSPYLTPTPFRGKRNESSYVTYVAQEISKLRGISVETLTNAVIENYQRVFKSINVKENL